MLEAHTRKHAAAKHRKHREEENRQLVGFRLGPRGSAAHATIMRAAVLSGEEEEERVAGRAGNTEGLPPVVR